ncbi:MAG: IS110 family transposase [Acetobacteraceae bacterium]|nr:IS110 family transposase [Acetobacteraceae bacterium]MBV8573928.1 IS110 family transposase [Acetobacteraceae bacterium]
MDVLYPRCAGLDVHKDSVVAGVRVATGGPATTEVRTFDATTPGLLALSAWLAELGCTHVAMEATGVYWKPVWHILSDGDITLILANAAHVRNVPGRKTDVADAVWLADLLAHGLIRPSFVPEAPTQEMRALLRTRKQLVREQASHVQRLQKTLEDANLKLGSVLTQIMGVSGRAILQALIDGERDPDKLLTLVQRGVKAPPEKLRAALQGRVTEAHRFLLRLHLRQVDALDAAITEIDAEVDRDLDPFRDAVRLLRSIPGVSDLTAQVIVSEIGIDMSRFPTAGHLISWAGLCPRNDESAGKRRSTRLRKGAPWLKTTLVQCAWAASHKKASYLQAQFRRLQHRRGPKKAVCAVAASILTAAYHMLRDGTFYQDLSASHFNRASPEQQVSRYVRQIAKLGFTCVLTPTTGSEVSV